MDMVGKTATWKIRVHGPSKFTNRTEVIAWVNDRIACTADGHTLRLGDMVPSADKVIGGGTWAIIQG